MKTKRAASGTENAEQVTLNLIKRWEETTHTLDYLLQQALDNPALPVQTRAKITDLASNWARGRGSARFLLDGKLKKGLKSLPDTLRRLLELTVCRLLFDDRTPSPLLVSETVEVVKTKFGIPLANVSNAVLRAVAEKNYDWPDFQTDPAAHLAHSSSHPEWLVERWLERYGEDKTRDLLDWNNRRPDRWIRWNLLRGSVAEAEELLKARQISYDRKIEFPSHFRLLSSFYPQVQQLVEEGFFSVQDPSASLAVLLLEPHPGMTILDLCAAPGGKTTFMAQLTGNQAQITANDISADRLKQVKESVTRLDVGGVAFRQQDGRTKISSKYDAVLLDAPCSGLGVLSRRADLRWRRRPSDFGDLRQLQMELLENAAAAVKPGGSLVYSTCTIEPEENEEIVDRFLTRNREFNLADLTDKAILSFKYGKGQVAAWSPHHHIDGIYAAKLIRQS